MAMKFKVDGMMIACDEKRVWRYDLFPEYKGNRDKLRDPYYDEVKEVMIELKDFFNSCTSVPALSVERCEADDIIAHVAQNTQHKLIIGSSDRDFVQLINEDIRLYSPMQREERTTKNKEFELFEKCIRGDRGDNIQSAFPNVRKDRLIRAFEDKTEMLNLMESTNKNGQKVGDVYRFNKRLIDLTLQPKYIKDALESSINNLHMNRYNNVKMLKFIGQHDLKGLSREFMRNNHIFKKHFIN
jgi:hypothetical protein